MADYIQLCCNLLGNKNMCGGKIVLNIKEQAKNEAVIKKFVNMYRCMTGEAHYDVAWDLHWQTVCVVETAEVHIQSHRRKL